MSKAMNLNRPLRSPLWLLGLGCLSLPARTALGDPPPMTCEGDRYIGFAPQRASCVPIPNSAWHGAPLFQGDISGDLANYCVFTWTGNGPPLLGKLPTWGSGLDSPKLDCAVVTPHATELTMENQAALEAAFRAQADAVAPLPTPAPNSLAQPPTKVLVVDSSEQTGFPFPAEGLIEHGKMVGMIVRQLACPPGSPTCAAEVANTLALPLVKTPSGFARVSSGGRFGSFGDLALAIHQAMATAGTQPGKTVINLSVGWDGSRYGGHFAADQLRQLSPPIRAIYTAISLAVCRGALVIAASGNSVDGPNQSTGPSHPGAWEAKPAPTATQCSALAPGVTLPLPATSYQRLVYAVGGVDGRDTDLPNRRPLSRPPLVAPASHVSISNGAAEITDVFTGSSVASAVASAAAAIAWRYKPNQGAHDVMKLVREGGVPLPGRSVELTRELCFAPDCNNDVTRVSICGTLKRLQQLGASTNPQCTKSSAFRDARPDITTQSIQPLVCTQPVVTPVTATAPCVGQYYSLEPLSAHECPASQLANHHARPFSTPQPDGIACPTCPMELFAAYLNLNRDYAGKLRKPTIVIKPFNQDKKIIDLVVNEEALFYADPIKVEELPFSSTDTEWATVDFEVEADSGAYSSSSALIIVKDLP